MIKRIAVIVTCLVVLVAGQVKAQEATEDAQKIEVRTQWIDLHVDLPLVLSSEVAPPHVVVSTAVSPQDTEALMADGTILAEPCVTAVELTPGTVASEDDIDNDGVNDVGKGLTVVAETHNYGTILLQVDFWSYDRRPEAPEAEDGAILNPLYLLTARVVEQ